MEILDGPGPYLGWSLDLTHMEGGTNGVRAGVRQLIVSAHMLQHLRNRAKFIEKSTRTDLNVRISIVLHNDGEMRR